MLSVKNLKTVDKYLSIFSYFISIIIILNIKYGKTDEALDHLYPEMYKNSQNTWHHYVRMTIVRFVEQTQYSYTNIKQFNNEILKWLKLVLQLRYRQIKMYSNFDKKIKKITFVTGQFTLHSDEIHNHYFRFHINTRLSINITFVLIYFSSNNCKFGALRIQRDEKRHVLYYFVDIILLLTFTHILQKFQ